MTSTRVPESQVDEPSPLPPGAIPAVDALGGAAATGNRLRLVGSGVRLYGPPAIVFVLFIGAWYAFSASMSPRRRSVVLPYPHDCFQEAFLVGENLTELLNGLWITTQVAIVGLAIAIVLGVAIAVAMSQGEWIERSFYPYAVTLQAIPILALVPLIGTIWGFEFRSRVLVCVIIAIFPIITNTLFGLKSAERGLHDLFTLHSASRWTRLYCTGLVSWNSSTSTCVRRSRQRSRISSWSRRMTRACISRSSKSQAFASRSSSS